jgi:MarR family transcriptional regulator, negative regulator of the multidrug operon emrRAB
VDPSPDAHLINVLGALTVALSDRIRTEMAEVLASTGSAPTAVVVLEQLLAGRSTHELSQATGLTHSGAVRLVDRLVDDGLAERRQGRDGRSGAVVLTPAGRAVSRRLSQARERAIASSLASLAAEEREVLGDLVDRLVTALTTTRLDARGRGEDPRGWLCRLCDVAACGRSAGRCPAANAAGQHPREPEP